MVQHDEVTIAHLSMIQGVINRMASNSFALKALTVTIAAAVIALAGTQQSAPLILPIAGLLPVVLFWLADSQYLQLERLYRALYDDVRKDGQVEAFSMDCGPYKAEVASVLRLAVSWSLVWFYTAIVLVLVVVALLLG